MREAAIVLLLIPIAMVAAAWVRRSAERGVRLGPIGPAAVRLAFRFWLAPGAFHRARVVDARHVRLDRVPWLQIGVEGALPAPGGLVFLAWSGGRLLAWTPPPGVR